MVRADSKCLFYIRKRNSASNIRKTASEAKWKLAALCAKLPFATFVATHTLGSKLSSDAFNLALARVVLLETTPVLVEAN